MNNIVKMGPRQFEIPKDWQASPFEEVISRNPNYDIPDEETFEFLPMDAINEDTREVTYWNRRDKDDCTRIRFKEGDTVYGKITPCTENGKIACIDKLKGELAFGSTEFLVFSPKEGKTDSKFVFYLSNLPVFRQVTISLMEGSTGRQRVPTDVFEEALEVPVPSLPEQRRIAEILSTVDEAIQQTDEIIETSKELKKGLMQDLLTKGIGHEEFKEVKVPMMPQKWTMPEEWKIEFLEDLTTNITDGAHQTPTYVDEGVPFLKVENIQDEEIPWGDVSRIPEEEHEDLIKRCKPEKGDILLSKNGTIGLTRVVDWDREFSHFVSLCLLKPDHEKVDTKYLSEMVGSEICLEQAAIRSKTGTITNLHLTEIKQFSIPVPPLGEQREIAERLSVFDEKIRQEEEYREKLEELKKGLMQDLLTGEVRVEV